MARVLVIYSGDGIQLGRGELKAIHSLFNGNIEYIERFGNLEIIESSLSPVEIVKRAAFIKDAGELIFKGEKLDLESIKDWFNERGESIKGSFKVDSEGFGNEKKIIDKRVGDVVLGVAKTLKVNVKSPDFIIKVLKRGEIFVWISLRVNKRWVDRLPRKRPFFHPSALNPKVARFMVNLAYRGEPFLVDPFAGTGSIPIEAGLLGIYPIACDVDERMVSGCRENMKYFGVHGEVVQADARYLPFRELRCVATDLPYGRASSTRGAEFKDLLTSFLKELKKVLKGRAVIMYPEGTMLPEFIREREAYSIYVHKSLSRRISIVS